MNENEIIETLLNDERFAFLEPVFETFYKVIDAVFTECDEAEAVRLMRELNDKVLRAIFKKVDDDLDDDDIREVEDEIGIKLLKGEFGE